MGVSEIDSTVTRRVNERFSSNPRERTGLRDDVRVQPIISDSRTTFTMAGD